ncbi:MAG: T9SS type A sorting domain-containing protein [Flavobacteriia bacterium]
MKKTTLFIASVFLCSSSFAQLFSDNFDSYAAGSYLGPQSTSWSTWSWTEGATEDVTITNNNANSAPNSIYLASTAAAGGPQDVVLKFGQVYNSGIFTLQSDFFINSGKNAYFNIQAAATLGQVWALNVNMDAGQVSIDDGSTPNLAVGSYTDATWFTLKIEANLTLHVWKAYVNGALIGTWVNGVNAVAAADFYPVQNSAFYMDNVSFDHQTYTLPNLNAMIASVNMGGEIAGQNVTPIVKVLNAGATAITSFDVNLSYNSQNYPLSVTGVNIASIGIYTVNMPPNILVAGNQSYTATISNINGGNDAIAGDNTLTGQIDPVVPAVGKMVVGEEATGTWCQWCPRGAVFMDLFETKYDQYWAGIAVHNADPMTVTDYDAGMGGLISGYPSAVVDRLADVDPSGMTPDFFTRLQTAPVATMLNGATWDATTRVLNVSVTSNFSMVANSNYKAACVLTEDEVTGTGAGWSQSNAYAGGNNGVMGGFEALSNPVPAATMVYNHVARAISPSFNGMPNSYPATVNAGESYTMNVSFTLPADWDETKINIIGMIIDPTGKIENAGRATIAEAVTNGYVAGLTEMPVTDLTQVMTVYPNPASTAASVNLHIAQASNVSMKLVDFAGKVMSDKAYGTVQGDYQINLNTSNFKAGVYFVELTVNGQTTSKKLIIE